MFGIDFPSGPGNTNLKVILSKVLSESYVKCNVLYNYRLTHSVSEYQDLPAQVH